MDPWLIFDLLPTGPVLDAGMALKKSLRRVSASAATRSLPALKAAVARFENEEITLVEGLGEWLRALDVDTDTKAQIESFITVAMAHPKAVERALEPVLEDLDSFIG